MSHTPDRSIQNSPKREGNPTIDGFLTSLASNQHGVCVFDIDPQSANGRTIVTWGTAPAICSSNWLMEARQAVSTLPRGGLLAGYIGYEAGHACEQMRPPRSPSLLPQVHLRPTEGHMAYLHQQGTWEVEGTPSFRREAKALMRNAPRAAATRPPRQSRPLEGPRTPFVRGVQTALRHIRDGEVYQVNLAWESRLPAIRDPFQMWLQLRTDNPARRGAYVHLGPQTAVASNSPELYLEVVRDGSGLKAISTPIKGTVPQSLGRAGRDHLRSSPKELAELTMIADLVRNDLGRVAHWGGVACGPRTLTDCGDLVHAEQTITATLRADTDALAVVQASFPPGSVTGAPKVRAMQLIHGLEPVPRGVYTGAIGYFASDGTAHLNVAIRTVTCTPEQTSFHIGSGIVADSDPEAEWEETRAKGRQIHAVLSQHLGGHGP